MTSKLIPINPSEVMVIRKVTPDILTCSVPFLRFGHINIGGRGTIVRLQNGSLAVFSPVALTDDVRKQVESMGEVKYVAALDVEHHIFLEPWHKAYPSAKLLAPDALESKRKDQGQPLPFTHLFKKTNETEPRSVDPDFDREFSYEYVPSHANKELVFVHKPSRTLIEADLLFNLPATEQMSKSGQSATAGYLTRLFCGLQNTEGTAVWQKRFLWYMASASDRSSFNRSMDRINGWDFDRLIPCHGDVIEAGAKGIFQKVMEWHIAAAKKGQ